MNSSQWARVPWKVSSFLLAVCVLPSTYAQPGKVLLTREQCLEDVAAAFTIMDSVHPNLYSIVPKEELDRRRGALGQSLQDRVTTTAFFCQFAPMIAQLRDGHTSLPLPTAAFLGEESRKLLPIEIEIRDDRVIVLADYSDQQSTLTGAELMSINGRPVQTLIQEMMLHQHQELPSARRKRIAEFFRAYLWLLCDVEGPFELVYRVAGTDTNETVTLVGQTLASISAAKRTQAEGDRPLYDYHFDRASRVGILEYNACANDDRFRDFLRETFTRVQREQPVAMIVDARNNGGGSARANVDLFHYLTDKPYRMYSLGEVKVSQIIKQKLGREAFEERYFSWDSPNGSTQSYKFPLRQATNSPLRYDGPLFVLSGASTLSSGMNFVNAVKDYELGIIVGEETGNPATAFGDLEAFTLPNSQLTLYVSTKYFVRPNGSTVRRGVLPDYEVRQNDEDTRAGRDTVMEFTKQLVKQF